jgi:extracellular factor (EF) 3-hydroxypalmitic acid methyl ester biosynthesis protein
VLALMAAARSGPTVPAMTYLDTKSPDTTALWQWLSDPLAEYKSIVAAADRLAIKDGAIPAGIAARVSEATCRWETLLDDVIGDDAAATAAGKTDIGARLHAELLPYILLTRNAERWYAKPRGYAGDFLSIAWIYDDLAGGIGRIGPAIDRGFLHTGACRAVANRRGLLRDEIGRTMSAAPGGSARITSLACGPAQELLDVFAGLDDPGTITATLIDIDDQALDHVRARIAGTPIETRCTLMKENLVYAAIGRRELPVHDQDLVYSIGLIDYFPDRLVVALMNLAHRMLRPGGRLILGNFHPKNRSKALMDHILAWPLIHRDEADLNRLYAASAFGRGATDIRYEEQRINLFAACVKE